MTDAIDRDRSGWTRRGTLAAMTAAGAVAAAGPSLALPWRARAPETLRALCRAVAGTPAPMRIGALWAGDRDLATVEATLLSRLEPARTEAEWRASLLARGREDLACDDTVEVEGIRLMRTEAEVLAFGYLLREAELA